MNITSSTVSGMTPQEKRVYFDHMRKRHTEEAERVAAERTRRNAYRNGLIEDIVKSGRVTDRGYLSRLPIRTLERMLY